MSDPIEGVAPSNIDHAETLAGSTIAARAEACHDLLVQSSHFLHVYKDGGTRWVRLRDLTGRFNIWTSNMGAFAALHASLDYRLRDLADVKDLILEHLENMMDGMDRLVFLNNTKTFSEPGDNADYEAQTEPVGHEEIDAILSSLSTSIDWLHRLANMVRRAGTSRQNTKANTFALKHPEGFDITPALERLFNYWITRDFPTIGDDLRNRLISTMLLRRRRVLYRRSRQAKLAVRTAEPTPELAQSILTAPSAGSGLTLPKEVPRETTVPMLPASALSRGVSSQYTATTVEPETYRQLVSTLSKVNPAHTISMASGNEEMIPPPPYIAPNAREFVCPFCCLSLPAEYVRNHTAWVAHIKKDLDPYVCAFFPCAHSEDTFGTSGEWISHMQQTHFMRWYCAAKHRSEVFASQEGFIEHMKTKHPGKFNEAQLPFLAENSRRPLQNIFDACPLCGQKAGEKEKGLEHHIAHHLQYLALKSLPLSEDLDNAEGASTVSSADPRDRDEVAASRTTVKSERHLMPPATFSDEDDNPSDMARAVDDTIPDLEEQKSVDIAQTWQIIRMRNQGDEELVDLRAKGFVDSRVHIPERVETPPQPFADIPFSRDRRFIDRGNILNQIDQRFRGPFFRVALAGLGGIRKSQLAIEYAHRFASQNPNASIFWIHANTRKSVQEGFRTLADIVKLPGRKQKQTEDGLLRLVSQWLSKQRNGRWLLVFDSADDADIFHKLESGFNLIPLAIRLPRSPNGSILGTTRDKALGLRLANDIIDIDVMLPIEFLLLLENSLGPIAASETSTATELVEALDYIPLAISPAGMYIRVRLRSSLSDYLAKLREYDSQLARFLEYDGGELRRDRAVSNAVYTTWRMSFQNIRAKRPSASDLLSCMSFFDRQGIPMSWLRPFQYAEDGDEETSNHKQKHTVSRDSQSVWLDPSDISDDLDEFEEDLYQLLKFNLIKVNEDQDIFYIHRLVQFLTKVWLRQNGQKMKFI